MITKHGRLLFLAALAGASPAVMAFAARAADDEVVVTGSPEEVAACRASYTGSFLKAHLRA